jgi:N-acetylmuramoyl-L-alanine amidase
MIVPKPLTIDAGTGKLRSPDNAIRILYSNPFPIPYCSDPGTTGTMRGVVEHTTGGFWQSAVDLFESKDNHSGSAHFLVGTLGVNDGHVMQFVPIGQGYETYHAFSANLEFYGIETEDGGKSSTPISDKALWSWALLYEFLSRFGGFPLQLLVRESGLGLGYHRQFADWNRNMHSCPGASFTDMVRINQRDNIIFRAQRIRAAAVAKPRTPGHVAYAAYGDYLTWTDPVTGQDVPFWASLRRSVQLAWEAAAGAVQPK